MLGAAAQLGNTVSALPALSFISSDMSTKLDDMTDDFGDAFLFADKTDLDLQPRNAQIMTAQIEVPESASRNYPWPPLGGNRQIRLVKIIPSNDSHGLTQLATDFGSVTQTCDILSTSSPKQSFRATVQTAELGSPSRPRYVALSYTWLEFPHTFPLLVSDERSESSSVNTSETKAVLYINASLHSFLQRLFSDTSNAQALTLWIDQICIDQTNDVEKSQQVRLMKDIFANADKTFIWLGETDEDSDLAIKVLNSVTHLRPLAESEQQEQTYSQEKTKATSLVNKADLRNPNSAVTRNRTAIGRLLNRPYFGRAWIYQEAAVSRRALVKIGPHEIDFSLFSHAVTLYSDAEEQVSRDFGRSLSRSTKGPTTLGTIEVGRRKLRSFTPEDGEEADQWTPTAFLNLLTRLAGTVKAKDDRDLIFAFLGFLPQDPQRPLISPDYT